LRPLDRSIGFGEAVSATGRVRLRHYAGTILEKRGKTGRDDRKRSGMTELDERKLKRVIDPAVAKTFTHPLRGHVWVTLCERGVVSPAEVASELGLDVTEVSYHFRTLRAKGLIRLVRTERRRGFDEHFYEPLGQAFRMDDTEWMRLPAGIRTGFSGEMLRQVADSVVAALEAGSFDARNRHLSRIWLTLDERGWSELTRLLNRTLDRILEIQERSAARCRDSSEPSISVEAVMTAFETAAGVARRRAGETESL
jgi:DNA-binding transcriptional ArsR family regulator